jgi:hypothetical protein
MVYLGLSARLPTIVPHRIATHLDPAGVVDQPVEGPSRVAAQIVTGIGFIGVGLIFVREDRELRNAGKINLNRGIMWALLILAIAVVPAVAQQRAVLLTNSTRRAGTDCQIGERFEIVVTAATNQPVSVRTTMKCRTGCGPVVGWTDLSGRWPTTGQFEKGVIGNWSEVWTVGAKLASPALHFSVGAPSLKDCQSFAMMSGPNMVLTCETAEGRQTFATPSDAEPFWTPDGRVVRAQSIEHDGGAIPRGDSAVSHYQPRQRSEVESAWCDEAGTLITKTVDPNTLDEDEVCF